MGRANQTISGAPSPAPPPYFDSGLSLQCQVQVFYFWWRLFTVFCCLLPFAIAGACYWFWRKYLRDNPAGERIPARSDEMVLPRDAPL